MRHRHPGGGVMNQPLEVSISGGSVQPLAESTGALARQGFPPGGNTMYFGGDSFFYHPPESTPGYNGRGWEFTDPELLARVKKEEEERKKGKRPPPTAPNPHPPELIPDDSEALAVYTSPDVVKVGDKPVPFASHGKGSDDENYSPDVRSNGKIIKRHNSKMYKTYGAEPGDVGIKSGTDALRSMASCRVKRRNKPWIGTSCRL
jgi:hypothetical protein